MTIPLKEKPQEIKENFIEPRNCTRLMKPNISKDKTSPRDWAKILKGERINKRKLTPRIKVKKGIRITL